MIRSAPTLETERLVLRAFTGDDLDAHAAMLGDDTVMEFIGGSGLSREESWRKLAAGVGLWVLEGMGLWARRRNPSQSRTGRPVIVSMNVSRLAGAGR